MRYAIHTADQNECCTGTRNAIHIELQPQPSASFPHLFLPRQHTRRIDEREFLQDGRLALRGLELVEERHAELGQGRERTGGISGKSVLKEGENDTKSTEGTCG